MAAPDSARAVRVRVPAKLNLHLAVRPPRRDGFHDIHTVFHAVTLYDEVTARWGHGVSLAVSGCDDLPLDSGNLAWRAATLLADYAGTAADVSLDLLKRIPVAGGLAGGSADGAAALLACATLWNLDIGRAEMAHLAARLGSDVAFPLAGGTALGTGRGEQLAPVLTTGSFDWVLAPADFGISAGAAYAELDRLRASRAAPPPIGTPDQQLDALRAGDAEQLAATLANDLQAAAVSLRPGLDDVLAAGVQLGALNGIVSGSGPTCAFLCRDEADARRLSDELDETGVCAPTVVVSGPAHGARVLP